MNATLFMFKLIFWRNSWKNCRLNSKTINSLCRVKTFIYWFSLFRTFSNLLATRCAVAQTLTQINNCYACLNLFDILFLIASFYTIFSLIDCSRNKYWFNPTRTSASTLIWVVLPLGWNSFKKLWACGPWMVIFYSKQLWTLGFDFRSKHVLTGWRMEKTTARPTLNNSTLKS